MNNSKCKIILYLACMILALVIICNANNSNTETQINEHDKQIHSADNTKDSNAEGISKKEQEDAKLLRQQIKSEIELIASPATHREIFNKKRIEHKEAVSSVLRAPSTNFRSKRIRVRANRKAANSNQISAKNNNSQQFLLHILLSTSFQILDEGLQSLLADAAKEIEKESFPVDAAGKVWEMVALLADVVKMCKPEDVTNYISRNDTRLAMLKQGITFCVASEFYELAEQNLLKNMVAELRIAEVSVDDAAVDEIAILEGLGKKYIDYVAKFAAHKSNTKKRNRKRSFKATKKR